MESWLIRIADYLLAQSWQIAILAVAVAIACLALRNRSAHVRYLLWLVVLAKCLVPPLNSIPVAVLPPDEPTVPAFAPARTERTPIELEGPRPTTTGGAESTSAGPQSTLLSAPKVRVRVTSVRARLVLVWIVGAVTFLLVYLIKALRMQIWLRAQRRALPSALRRDVENVFSAHGITRLPRIWLIDGVGQPFVWGLARGGVYLPVRIAEVKDSKLWTSLVGHELSHVLRFDAAINVLQVLAQVVFWFHPFVWWANRKLRQEREKCCDEATIARTNARPEDYSSAIVEALAIQCDSTRPVPSLAVAGPVRNVEERIRTMLRPGRKFCGRPSLPVIATVVLVALLIVPMTFVPTARADQDRTFDRPTNLGPTVNSLAAERDPHISADGLSLYFRSRRPGGHGDADIWVTVRKTKSDPWAAPVNLGAPINTDAFEGAPCLSHDGLSLYFVSTRPGGCGYRDIWVAMRQTRDHPWGTPVNLGSPVNSPAGEDGPSISADGLSLYFSDCPGGSPRSDGLGGPDIWVTTRKTKDDPWGKPVNLGPVVNSYNQDALPSISADGLTLYFGSTRLPRLGASDIWVTRRASKNAPWSRPVNLGPTINSPDAEDGPDISGDGSTLYFVSRGSDIWCAAAEEREQASSLQSAAFVGDVTKVKALLDTGANVNGKNHAGVTALYAAAYGGHEEMVKLLLAAGADANVLVGSRTVLHWAAEEGHQDIAEILVVSGADVNAHELNYGKTPAEFAMAKDHSEIAKMLIDKGAHIPPLHFALYMKDRDKARSLIQEGADVNGRTSYGTAPLHVAVSSMLEQLVALLINEGADVNARDNWHWTALHGAAFKGNKAIAEMLIAAGAEVNVKDGDGLTPIYYAKHLSHGEIVDVLRKHGGEE